MTTGVEWECSESSCYYMPPLAEPANKADADAFCEAVGAHVLATETQQEQDYITAILFEDCKLLEL